MRDSESSRREQEPEPHHLRTPQARVLSILVPKNGDEQLPLLTRVELAERAGFSTTSGTINRVLHGVSENSSSGGPHKGLLDLQLLERVVEGGINRYRITPAGIKAIKAHPELPEMRDKDICINNRYLQDIVHDLAQIDQQDVVVTTKKALVDARLGQGKFRDDVLEAWENCCAVTGSMVLAAIRASHIKPWRASTNDERLDPNNGLPLIASLDALFDAGLISFNSSGQLLVSGSLNTVERGIFGITKMALQKKPSAKTSQYLAYHRAQHGFG